MKLKALVENVIKKSLLQAQANMIELLDDTEWEVDISQSELVLAHPKFPGQVQLGPLDHSDLDGHTETQVAASAFRFYQESGLKPVSAKCTNVAGGTVAVIFKNLNQAFDAACVHSGLDLYELEDRVNAETVAEILNSELRPA